MIRFFDFIFSLIGLAILSPVLLLVALVIWIDDPKGKPFYVQKRVGKAGKEFSLYKFRSMRIGADKLGLITVGGRDPRITRVGYRLRKYKIDELPQLVNVLLGDMSLVGPRPEVRKYVDMYTTEQRSILSVRPGITDYASIYYIDENEILDKAEDPDKAYIEIIIPEKIKYNKIFINHPTVWSYFKIIFLTIKQIFR